MANGKLELYGMTPIRALPMTTHNELIALTTISSFQGQNESAFPGLDKLSQRSGISKQAFSKAVTGLVKKSLVNRKRRYGSSNIYFVVWEFADKAEIKKENDSERRMSRAKILAKNIQSSEPIGYINQSDVDCPNNLDVSHPNQSDNILKEQYKRTVEKNTLTTTKHIELKERLKSINTKRNLTYQESNKSNQYLEQASKTFEGNFIEYFEGILTKLEKLSGQPMTYKFKKAFTIESLTKFNLEDCSKVEAWYNEIYPSQIKNNIVQFAKPTEKEKPVFTEEDFQKMAGILK